MLAPVAVAATIMLLAALIAPWIVGKGAADVPQPLVQLLAASAYRVTSAAVAMPVHPSNSNRLQNIRRSGCEEAGIRRRRRLHEAGTGPVLGLRPLDRGPNVPPGSGHIE